MSKVQVIKIDRLSGRRVYQLSSYFNKPDDFARREVSILNTALHDNLMLISDSTAAHNQRFMESFHSPNQQIVSDEVKGSYKYALFSYAVAMDDFKELAKPGCYLERVLVEGEDAPKYISVPFPENKDPQITMKDVRIPDTAVISDPEKFVVYASMLALKDEKRLYFRRYPRGDNAQSIWRIKMSLSHQPMMVVKTRVKEG